VVFLLLNFPSVLILFLTVTAYVEMVIKSTICGRAM